MPYEPYARRPHTAPNKHTNNVKTAAAINELASLLFKGLKRDSAGMEDLFIRLEGLLAVSLGHLGENAKQCDVGDSDILERLSSSGLLMAENAMRLTVNTLVKDGTVSLTAVHKFAEDTLAENQAEANTPDFHT